MLTNVSYRRYKPEDTEKTSFVIDVFSFLTQNLNLTGPDRKLEILLERDYIKMIWDNCVSHKFNKFIYMQENFIELSQPHITYQKANNIVIKFVEEDMENIDLLKSALRNHLQTIQYVYSLLFPKIYNRTNRFGINNKSHFYFIFTNWRHHKSNLILSTPTKSKVAEQPTKKIIPEINKTQKQEQQQEQQQQNEQQKEEILEARKRVAHPFEQRPEKSNEMPPPPAVKTTAPSKPKSFMPTAKSVIDARVAKKRAEKKARLQKQLSENTER